MNPLLEDNEPESTSGYIYLIIHVILKAVEDYYNKDSSPQAESARESAAIFFDGHRSESNYATFLEFLGWDPDEHGVITAERWYEIIEESYSSVADAKPKIGLSTRLIPTGTKLWEAIRAGREREIDDGT